jgi:hypothetical protein
MPEDLYFHVTADFCRLKGSNNWTATIHTYTAGDHRTNDVKFHGVGELTFSDVHEIASVLRSIYTDAAITQCGVQLDLMF